MSLEELLGASIAATKEQTAAMNRNSDLMEIIIGKAKSNLGAAAAEKTEEKAEEPGKRTRATKAAEEPPKKKAKAPTPADMTKATTDFLEVDDDEEYATRRDLVKKILAKYDAKKMSEVAEDDRQAALDILTSYKAGDPTGLEEDEPKRRSRDDDMA